MKKIVKKLLTLIMALAMGMSLCLPVQASEMELETTIFSPIVNLKAGKSFGAENYELLRTALQNADGCHALTVTIHKKGNYYVSSPGKALKLRSKTTLNLNGSTLIRSGGMGNLLQVETVDGLQSVAGYSCARDVVVENGGLDGSGNLQPGSNLTNFGHVNGLTLRNLNFRHGQGTHLLELNGCKNVMIDSCTFSEFDPAGKTTMPEAIQLDISYNGASSTWNGVYCKAGTPGMDCTVCRNVTVKNCVFRNYPSGVGNHHGLKVYKNTKIRIINNRFENAKKWALAPAVNCCSFYDCVVSGNTIKGYYSAGISISGGTVKVNNNVVGMKKNPVRCPAVLVNDCRPFVPGCANTRVTERTTSGWILDNRVYTSCSYAFDIQGSSKLTCVKGNTVYTKKKMKKKEGIYKAGCGSKVGKSSGNKCVFIS